MVQLVKRLTLWILMWGGMLLGHFVFEVFSMTTDAVKSGAIKKLGLMEIIVLVVSSIIFVSLRARIMIWKRGKEKLQGSGPRLCWIGDPEGELLKKSRHKHAIRMHVCDVINGAVMSLIGIVIVLLGHFILEVIKMTTTNLVLQAVTLVTRPEELLVTASIAFAIVLIIGHIKKLNSARFPEKYEEYGYGDEWNEVIS